MEVTVEVFVLVLELLIPLTVTMDPPIRVHNAFRFRNGHSKVLSLFDHFVDSSALSSVDSSSASDRFRIHWMRKQKSGIYDTKTPANDEESDTDVMSSERNQLWPAFLRSGKRTIRQAQPRQARQTLYIKHFYIFRCTSHLINAYLNMIPNVDSPGTFLYQGAFWRSNGSSQDSRDLFAKIRYSVNLYQIINRSANRTICTHAENGSVYSVPLQFYTHEDSHECIFRRVPVSPRRWCPHQTGLKGSIYLTTSGRPRALAMTVRDRGLPPEVITIPWDESGGPENGCSPPRRGCYTWSDKVVHNCGITGNDCVTHRRTTTPSGTVAAHACAKRYCEWRTANRKARGNPVSLGETVECIEKQSEQIEKGGDSVREAVCNHGGFTTTTTVKPNFIKILESENDRFTRE